MNEESVMSTAACEKRTEAITPDAVVARVIGVVDELIVLIEDENRNLARGLPASLSGSAERKNALATGLEVWVAHVERHRVCAAVADAALRERLVERVGVLRVAMDENIARLKQAIAASRRRVDAIMRAIRDEVATRATYGDTGRMGRPIEAGAFCKGIRA